jgi:hypothetical protein
VRRETVHDTRPRLDSPMPGNADDEGAGFNKSG